MGYTVLESKSAISFDQITALAKKVGWGDCYYKTKERWQRVLDMSSYIAYVKEGNDLIAFGRVLEDGMMCMFYDVCVDPAYQGRGIGTLIMNSLIDKVKDGGYFSLGLIIEHDNPTAEQFYMRLGFEKVNAMELQKYMADW